MARIGILFRLCSALVILLWKVLYPIYKLYAKVAWSARIPPTDERLLHLSATKLAMQIRTGKISSEKLVKAVIKRITEVNPFINAVVEDRFKEALQEALNVDEFLNCTTLTESELESTKPLLGVPVTIKETLSVKGLSYTSGSKIYEGQKAAHDGDCVKLLREAGAIPVCVSNTPDSCLSIETYNLITGRTNNPYNTQRTSGGSSGGEGALVGSGASVFGLGSDIAGSIRIPACFNGVFGHKFSADLVALRGNLPYHPDDPRYTKQLSIGPLVRYAEDLVLAAKVLTGENKKLQLDERIQLESLKLYYMEDCGNNFGLLCVHEKVKQAIRHAAKHLKNVCKVNVIEKKFDGLKYAVELSLAEHFAQNSSPPVLEGKNAYLELFKLLLGRSTLPYTTVIYGIGLANKKIFPGTLEEIDEEIENLRETIQEELSTNGVLLFPSYPTAALPHYGAICGTTSLGYLCIFNALGLPATNTPIGYDEEGMPLGIQVIAAHGQDRLCFAIAKELETLFGGWNPPYWL